MNTTTKLLTLVMNLVTLTEQKAAAATQQEVLAILLAKGDLSDEVKADLERRIDRAEEALRNLTPLCLVLQVAYERIISEELGAPTSGTPVLFSDLVTHQDVDHGVDVLMEKVCKANPAAKKLFDLAPVLMKESVRSVTLKAIERLENSDADVN